MVRVEEDNFGTYTDPITNKSEPVRRFTISNDSDMSVQVMTLGATITSVKVPNAKGIVDEINLGFDDLKGYIDNGAAYIGSTIGPVCNRIGNGILKLDEGDIKLSINNLDKHQLHGGKVGYTFAMWEVESVRPDGVTFRISPPEGHEGYPGQITASLTFTVSDDNVLKLLYEAETTKQTAINMTNHAYFNLAGHGAGKDALYAHNVQIKADKSVEVDAEQVPTGQLTDLAGSEYDFCTMANLGERLKKLLKAPISGIDKNYCLCTQSNGGLVTQAKVCHPGSGRWVEVSSNQPSMVFYTSNNLPDVENSALPIIGIGGANYVKHGAFCMETQKYPDATKHSNFPKITLNPGEKYKHEVHYRFGIGRKASK